MRMIHKVSLALGVAIASLAIPASATHVWGGYHWARQVNPFTIQVGDNVTTQWDASLAIASTDWTASTVLNTQIVAGGTKARRCGATAGKVEVCNATYGNTQWLGIASISITSGNHITAGTVKLNDTYYNTATYNTPAWRQLVMCQEIGHTFGLGHQDENFANANLNTCMDYTNQPTTNQHPNVHDYDLLLDIYSHLDSTTTIASGMARSRAMPGVVMPEIGDTPKTWGRPVHFLRDGRPDVYMRIDGPGRMTVTHVFWIPGKGPQHIRDDGTHAD